MVSKQVVVDSSVIAHRLLKGRLADKARQLLVQFANGEIGLTAPDLIAIEVANILWKQCAFGGMELDDAQELLDEFFTVGVKLVPSEELLYTAFSIAVTHKRTVYDSLYLALSLQEDCRFVTTDEKLFNAVSAALPNVVLLQNWS